MYFNYGCLHLSLGLLLHNADDSVKEGDGERLMRVWKFLTFVFRSHGKHKYALGGAAFDGIKASTVDTSSSS